MAQDWADGLGGPIITNFRFLVQYAGKEDLVDIYCNPNCYCEHPMTMRMQLTPQRKLWRISNKLGP